MHPLSKVFEYPFYDQFLMIVLNLFAFTFVKCLLALVGSLLHILCFIFTFLLRLVLRATLFLT